MEFSYQACVSCVYVFQIGLVCEPELFPLLNTEDAFKK